MKPFGSASKFNIKVTWHLSSLRKFTERRCNTFNKCLTGYVWDMRHLKRTWQDKKYLQKHKAGLCHSWPDIFQRKSLLSLRHLHPLLWFPWCLEHWKKKKSWVFFLDKELKIEQQHQEHWDYNWKQKHQWRYQNQNKFPKSLKLRFRPILTPVFILE